MANYLQTAKHATNAFGLENAVLYNNYPMHKFEFAVRIVFNSVTGTDQRKADALTFIVKNVKLPPVTINADEMNEYNRTRINYGRLQFGDCSLVLHDVADGKVMRFWKDYYEYFFSDGKGRSFGYSTLLIPDKNRKYYIDSIDIFQFQAGRSNRTTLMNPKITSFDQGNLAYDETTGISEITLNFKPEYIKYEVGAGIPDHIQDFLRRGAPVESLAQQVSTILPEPVSMSDLNDQLLRADNATTGVAMIERYLNEQAESFNNNVQQPIETRKVAGSSALSSFGFGTEIFKVIGKPQ